MKNINQIHDAKVEGHRLTDGEVLKGMVFFKDLSDMLAKCGPVFRLAFKEANDTYNVFYDYAKARKLDIPESYKM